MQHISILAYVALHLDEEMDRMHGVRVPPPDDPRRLRLVRVLRALADEVRLRLLQWLLEGDATVSDLADRLGLDQPRVSTHLAALREAGLVLAHAAGRQRVYHVDAQRIAALLEVVTALALGDPPAAEPAPASPAAGRLVRRDAPLRHARTCYDHLAGVAGVQLLDALVRRGWLLAQEQGRRTTYTLSPGGERALQGRGVDVSTARRARRMFAFACLDWTERRPHLGGALGAAILTTLVGAGIARRHDAADPGRSVVLLRPLEHWLGSG
jgi:DNA-binding transcriptional ArsR family regulator